MGIYVSDLKSDIAKMYLTFDTPYDILYENDPEYKGFHKCFINNYITKFPIRLVVITNEKCIGTVTLIDNDFPGKSYGPWLGGLFIDAQYRNCGIGQMLLEEGIKIIKDLGYHELYLTTHTASRYYKRFGWQSVEFCKSDDGFDEEIFKFTIAHLKPSSGIQSKSPFHHPK